MNWSTQYERGVKGLMTVTSTVTLSRKEDAGPVTSTLTEAFMGDPLARWLFPDEEGRRRLQPYLYRSLVEEALAARTLRVDGAGHAAAVWLHRPTDPTPAEPDDHGEADLRAVFGRYAVRVLHLVEAITERHPGDEPHTYLACLGVLPSRQGQGLGGALLRDELARADQAGTAAYLEASSPRNRALYERHGFEPVGEPIRLAGGPCLWPMWRPAKPPTPMTTRTVGEMR